MLLDATTEPKGWHETFKGLLLNGVASLAPGWGYMGICMRPVPVWALSTFLALVIIMAIAVWIARRKDTPLAYGAAFELSGVIFVLQTATMLLALP